MGYAKNDLFIQFWHKFQFDSLNDGGIITASIDTFDFKNIIMLQDNPYLDFIGFNYTADNIFGSDTGYTGSSENWNYTEIHILIEPWVRLGKISEYDDTFHLRFNIISDSIITGDAGWAIDNIVFGGFYGSDIDNNEPAVLIKTYPNPATDMVYIYAAGSQNLPLTILISDVHGRPVKHVKDVYTNDGNIKLNIENIPSRIYTVHIQSDNKKYFGRLIKQ